MKHVYGWLEEVMTRHAIRRMIRATQWALWLHYKADHGKHTEPGFRR